MRFIMILLVLLSFTFAQHQQLQVLIDQALKNNPALKARGHQSKAARALVESSGALPDPTVGFGLMNLPVNSFAFDQEPMTGKQITFNQTVPFPGKLGLKKTIARLQADKTIDMQKETKLKIIYQVKTLYFKIFDLDRAIEVTEKNQIVLKNFIQIAQTRYTVGRGLQQDVLKAQVEYARFFDQLISLKEKREALTTQLNAVLNQPPNQNLAKTFIWEFKPLTVELDTLQFWLLKENPILLAWQKSIAQSNVKIHLAKKNFLPDFNVTLAYTQRDVLQSGMGGIDYFSAALGLKIPLYFWKKQKNELQASRFKKEQTSQQMFDVKNQLLSALQDAYQRANKKAELIELYKSTIIPQGSQALNSAIAAYQNDKVDFLTLLNNLMVLFKYERSFYSLISEYYQQLAKIEYLSGKQIIK